MPNTVCVFCHGLNGYGQYDEKYKKKPYWGGKSGDVVAEWREKGVCAYAASVAPQGSAWDRACELYAQIAGARTDYGKAHSEQYRHARIGRDFTGNALIPSWDDDTRLVLIGHSFGGVTVRLLAELLANGSDEERDATAPENLSPLFAGGLGERVSTIVTLAAPTNGTTAYDLATDPNFNAKKVKVPIKSRLLDRVVKRATRIRMDGRDERDWANFDMTIDNAHAINERISTLSHVRYISLACDATVPAEGDARVPDTKIMDPLLVRTGTLMGVYSAVTAGGVEVDDSWHANDGLVNTISARAPFGAPQKPLDRNDVERGVWNVMPDMRVDHAFFSGDYLHKTNPHPFFQDLLELLQSLE